MGPAPLLPTVLVLLLAAAGLLLAGLLVRRGARGKRVGDTPHCRKCEYPLRGIDSDRCPECGADLRAPGGVVVGERVPRRGPAALGVGIGLVALFVLVAGARPVVRYFDHYRLMPTGWLVNRVGSPTPAVANRAWAELNRRMQDGDLAVGHRARLADQALAQQAAGRSSEVVEWLGRAVDDGKIPEPQRTRFFQQAVVVTLRLRPVVVAGEPIPYEVRYQGRFPAERWWAQVAEVKLSVDGGAGEVVGSGGGFRGFGAGGSFSSTLRAPGAAPGRHAVSVSARIRIIHAPADSTFDPNDPAQKAVHEGDFVAGALTDVVTSPEAAALHVSEDPSLGPKIRACLAPVNFVRARRSSPPGRLSGELGIYSPPIGIAFDAFARFGGREQRLGSVTVNKGARTNYLLRSDGPAPTGESRFDLVLRTNLDAARRTVDLFEVWKGEIVWPDVRFGDEP